MARKRRKYKPPKAGKAQSIKRKKRKRTFAKTKARKKEVTLRKNFFPTMLAIFILWFGIFFIIYFLDPFSFGAIPLFFFILFFALLLSFSTLFANTRRGFLTAVGLTIFMLLRYFGIGNLLNLILIIGLALTIEIYFLKSQP